MAEILDPAVNLPDSIKRQIEHGEAVRAALEKGEAPPVSTQPPNVKVVDNAKLGVSLGETPQLPTNPSPPKVKREPPPVVTQQDPPSAEDEDDDRFSRVLAQLRTLQGKYNSEIPRYQQQVKELQEKLNTAYERIAELASRPSFENPTFKKPLTGGLDYDTLPPEDEEALGGSEAARAIERRARKIADEIVSARLAELQPRIEKLDGSVKDLGRNAQLTQKERCAAYLATHVPGWEEINNDPLFVAWLQDEDPLSGEQRNLILAKAMAAGRFDRVAMIFKGYSEEQDLLVPHTRSKGNGKPKVKADTLVAPSGGRSEVRTPPAPATPEVFDGQDIREFYNSLARNNHGLSQAEIDDIEKRIFAAISEGRVISRPRV